MDIHSMKKRSRSSTADSTVEKLSETCANMANGDGNSFIDTFFEPMKDQTMVIIDKQFGGEEDNKETHELTLRAAREALQDDINLAAENVPRFRSALVGEVYTIEGDLPQLSATVIPQSIFTKRSQRTAVDAQYEQILHRWGPFDDPFLDTAPGPGGLSRRTRALVKLCGVVLPGEKAEHEIREVGESEADAESSEPVAVYADDPFVDTPLRKSRSLKRTDSAIDLGECRGGRAEGASTGMCKQPAYRELSPIKRVYPHGSMWKNAVVPRFEPSPSRCIWA
ncbi:hypothetical protein DOTSEDRAFT_74378 [Dothistroma septosporum NZE10]|uniref:Uncharacterized protein n=1 Tax=Dothistroma septosporum (strain NZE10 / CBS 128990) TaxID=675120 RepID=N1PFB9_DOTSN|nr:hypothetical protein DOTSEDRAFT_74378 [Dothistroma septosporum NZE10]